MKKRAVETSILLVALALSSCILPPKEVESPATASAGGGGVTPCALPAGGAGAAETPSAIKPSGPVIFDGKSVEVQNVDPAGSWYAMADDSPKGRMSPDPKGDLASALLNGVIHTQGKGFKDWGGGLGFNFVESEPLGWVDASGFTGISVKASGTTAMVVALATTATMPEFRKCKKCYDHYVVTITDLKPEPKVYTFKWSQMKADGWGEPEAKLDPHLVVGLNFTSKGPTSWDFAVHSVSFTQ